MNTLVESLKRLYNKGRLTPEQLEERVTRGTISEEELAYILGDDEDF